MVCGWWLGLATVSLQASPSFNRNWAGAAVAPVLGVLALPLPCKARLACSPRELAQPRGRLASPRTGLGTAQRFLTFTGDWETCGQSCIL